jgi:hypothetical protein
MLVDKITVLFARVSGLSKRWALTKVFLSSFGIYYHWNRMNLFLYHHFLTKFIAIVHKFSILTIKPFWITKNIPNINVQVIVQVGLVLGLRLNTAHPLLQLRSDIPLLLQDV